MVGYLGCRQTEETVVNVGIRADCISNLSNRALQLTIGACTLNFVRESLHYANKSW